LLAIRQLIFKSAAADDEIGEITETLKWGEAAYLTEQTGSGSTIRLGYKDNKPDCAAIYFNCQTTLIKDIQQHYPDKFEYQDNRALFIPIKPSLPSKELKHCINMALKYHKNKKLRKAGLI